MISLKISIDDEEMEPYRGDGVIISTPTGSTAYSLSCGGPVVEPWLDAIIMTPISSYKVTKRPLVIHPARTIYIETQNCKQAVISIDGQVNIDFKANYKIEVRTAPTRLKFAAINRRPFFSLVDRTGK
jgi:NAD+ kinase